MKKYGWIFILVVLSGCMSMGRQIDQNTVDSIQKGVTTKAEVIKKLGTPFGTGITDSGKEKLDYVFIRTKTKAKNFIPVVGLFVGGADQERQTLQILIGKDGKVENLSFNKTNDEIKMGIFS